MRYSPAGNSREATRTSRAFRPGITMNWRASIPALICEHASSRGRLPAIPRLQLSEIAALLGYAEQSPFFSVPFAAGKDKRLMAGATSCSNNIALPVAIYWTQSTRSANSRCHHYFYLPIRICQFCLYRGAWRRMTGNHPTIPDRIHDVIIF